MELYDPYASADLPSDVEALRTVPSGALGNETPFAPAGASPVLDRWDILNHKYRRSAEASVGFLGKLFAGTTKTVKAGVTQEARQYRIDKSEDGRIVETGVAVRLAVATSSFDVSSELSVPNLAAAAQLGLADTRIGIYVMGYSGPIGDIMPAPADLNVENFASFMAAFGNIQRRVFGPDTVSFLSPTILGYQSDNNLIGAETLATAPAQEGVMGANAKPHDNAAAASGSWRLAAALNTLRAQVDALAPDRSKAHDGPVGDEASASDASDSMASVEDGGLRVSTSIEITHDPDGGCNAEVLAQALGAAKDPRIKQIIWNGKIMSSADQPWTWRGYNGEGSHAKHIQICVLPDKSHYDSDEKWAL